MVRYEDLDAKGRAIWKKQGKPVPGSKEAAKKLEPPQQKRSRLAQEKGRVKTKIFEAYERRKPEIAIKLFQSWNASNKGPLFFEEVDQSKFYEWYIRKEIKKLNP